MSVILSLVFATSVSFQDLNRLVTAEVRGSSAPVAIAELSKQVGYPLEAMSSTKEDMLIIKVDKVPLKDLLNRIAKATNTAWEQTATGMRLVRTDALRRQERIDEQATLTKEIQEAFDKMAKRQAEDGELTERSASLAAERLTTAQERQQGVFQMTDWREQQRLNSMAPAYRLLRKMSPNLEASTLASIPLNRNIVFSSQPTRMQRAMPVNVQPLLQTFLKEQAIWAKAMKAAKDRRGGQTNYYLENSTDPSQSRIGKVLLVMHRGDRNQGGIQLRLSISDERGRALGTAQESIGWDWEASNKLVEEAQRANPKEEGMVFAGASKRVSEAMQEAFKSAQENRGQPQMNLPADVKEILANPDKTEPLSLMATDAFFETARIMKLNVVCSAPDMVVFGVYPMVQGSPKPSTFLASLRMYAMDAELKDGWLVVNPHVPSESRMQRTDRVVLGQYLRRAMKEGRLTIDNRAEYAYRSNKEQEEYMPMFLLSMLGLMNNEGYGGDWDTMRLYGSLTASQRQAAKTSQPIPFRSLQPGQIEILRHVIFDSPWPRLQMNYEAEDWAEMQNDDGVYVSGLSMEATEVLPNGFTGAETLTITEQNEPKFFAKYEAESSGGPAFMMGEQAFDVNGLAYEMFQNERPELFPWRSQPGYPRGAINKLRMGNQRQVTFMAKLTKRANMHMQLSDKTYQGAEMSIDKLPADIKKQIQDHLVKIREQHKNAKAPDWHPGGGGTTSPPPPTR